MRKTTAKDSGRLVSVADAAERLGLSEPNLRKMLRDRRLAHVRLGRRLLVPESGLDALVRANLIPAR